MKNVISLLVIVLGISTSAVSQDRFHSPEDSKDSPVLTGVDVLTPESYFYEGIYTLVPNSLLFVITPMKDTLIFGNKTFFSRTKTDNLFGRCVFPKFNPKRMNTDSVYLGIAKTANNESQMLWQQTIIEKGYSSTPMDTLVINPNEMLILREIYKRKFDCGTSMWLELVNIR